MAVELYALIMKKKEYIQNRGYNYVCKWLCEFHKDLATNPELKSFVNAVNMTPRLELQDSCFGPAQVACACFTK